MVELIVRIVAASVALASAGFAQGPEFDVTWRGVAFFVVYSALLYMGEQKSLRNPGISGLAAGTDAALIALLLQSSGQLERFGFLTLAPAIWAASRHGANPVLMAPIVAAVTVSASNLFGGTGPSSVLLAQAAGVLMVGLVAGRSRTEVEVKEVVVEVAAPSEMDLVLRDKLRDALSELQTYESRLNSDRVAVALSRAMMRKVEPSYEALAHTVRDACGATGLVLMSYDAEASRLTVSAVDGTVPAEAGVVSVELPRGHSEASLKSRVQRVMNQVCEEQTRDCVATFLIKDGGRIVGAAVLFHPSPSKLETSLSNLEQVDDLIAQSLVWLHAREAEQRRITFAEVMYSVATASHGASDRAEVAKRVLHDVFAPLGLDHMSVVSLDGQEPTQLAVHGAQTTILDLMDFGGVSGVRGWMVSGMTEITVDDARQDSRVDSREALKRRVGSYVLVPIQDGDAVLGYLAAAMHRAGGIHDELLGTLRLICGEMGQAWIRMSGGSSRASGLVTPAELRKLIAQQPIGCLVYLDVPRKDEVMERYGKPAFERALRQLALRLKATLPQNGQLCRREDGDYVAYLPGQSDEEARQWGNQALATSALVPLTTPDGRKPMPIRLRAKVAALSPQYDRLSSGGAA